MPTTTTTFEVDDTGLEAVRAPRDGLAREVAAGADRFALDEGPFDHYERTLQVEGLSSGSHRVTETTRWDLAIPIWGVLFRPLVRRALARHQAPEVGS